MNNRINQLTMGQHLSINPRNLKHRIYTWWNIILMKLKPNGKSIGRSTKHSKLKTMLINPNFMYWICFPIHRERVYTLAIHWDTSLQIFTVALCVTKDTTCYILWDTILLAYLLNNMRFKPDSILPKPPKPILLLTVVNWIKWASPLIGVGKYALPIRIITSILNGFLSNYLNLITARFRSS